MFWFNGLYKGYFKEILILQSESEGGIWRRWSGFDENRKKVYERTAIE